MRILGKIPTTILLLFFLFTAPCTADIKSVKIQSHNRDLILFSKFEYSNSGYVSVAVSSVGISTIPVTSNSSQPDPSRIGFFLLSNELQRRYDLEFNRNPDLCALDIKFITILLTFQNLSPPPQSSFNKSYNVTYPGEYSLYFVNCNDLSLVTMDVRTELYNNDGITKNYLSADQPQPSLKFFFIYLCFLGFWIKLCFLNKQYFEWIHLVMGVLLVITLLHLYCAAADQQHLKITGTHHLRWQVLFYIFQFLRNVVLYTLIILIGVGWCIWRRELPWWVIFNLLIVILLQVWANVSYTVAVGESLLYKEELNLKESVVFMNIVCGIVVFLPTFCSGIDSKEAEDTSTFVRSYNSLKGTSANPDVFIWLLLAYLIGLSWYEPGNLVFYMVIFYMFRPFDLDNAEKCAGIFDDIGDKV